MKVPARRIPSKYQCASAFSKKQHVQKNAKKKKKHTKTDEKNMSGNEAVFSIILAWFLGDLGVVWAPKSGKNKEKGRVEKGTDF